jgi:GntR family transcriptional repressor for pyruvate dehydrogenase complex
MHATRSKRVTSRPAHDFAESIASLYRVVTNESGMEAIKTQRVADAIATRIEKLILEGALRPGEKLASERELAQRLDVSRPSLRDAIDKLVGRGLLTATRGGTSVAEFLLPMMTPIANLYRDHENAATDYFEFR